jgi:iron complex transport system substrate-binding protein
LYALGAGDEIVGVTYACPQLRGKSIPIVSHDLFETSGYTKEQIASFLRMLGHQAQGLFSVDEAKLAECAPDVVFVQGSCEMCAPGETPGEGTLPGLPGSPRVVMLQPHSLGEVMADIRRIGEVIGRQPEAETYLASLKQRMMKVMRLASAAARPKRKRVLLLEWVDPPNACGLWLPELIDAAGGVPLLGSPQAPATHTQWETIVAAQPDVLIVAPTGFGVEAAIGEIDLLKKRDQWDSLPAVAGGEVFAADGAAYFYQPNARVVDSLELLASVLYPAAFGEPVGVVAARRVSAA